MRDTMNESQMTKFMRKMADFVDKEVPMCANLKREVEENERKKRFGKRNKHSQFIEKHIIRRADDGLNECRKACESDIEIPIPTEDYWMLTFVTIYCPQCAKGKWSDCLLNSAVGNQDVNEDGRYERERRPDDDGVTDAEFHEVD
ncbi:hypothetical protein ACFL6S_16920 [Candidatus Poribacteria bacterium]